MSHPLLSSYALSQRILNTSETRAEPKTSFIQGVILDGDSLNGAQPPDLESFRNLLTNGAIESGLADYSVLNQLFEGRTQLPEGAYDLQELSPQYLAKLKAKTVQGNITVDKFKKLHGYK